ncbi:MAG: penicillin-binding protein 1C [Crocinitomicaceae bacterium]|nr:penicillin-binding protein 1C [Crocinitomicaceae bacterium]
MKKKWNLVICACSLGTFLFFFFCLPYDFFNPTTSSVLYSGNGELMSAIVADDGQWRFPGRNEVPEKFKTSLLAYEDEHFFDHNGVYLPRIIGAAYQNIVAQKIVSGASTISMQVIRLSRNNPQRSFGEKIMEMIRAMRLEWRYSKKEILSLYASNAPYGGNVVGIDAAAWRYFGRIPEELSWAESAMLAVLPNAPSLIFPGKNQEKLLVKRNRLLEKLYRKGIIDEHILELSCLEPLPQKPFPLPQEANHLLMTACKKYGKGSRFSTSIDGAIQRQAKNILQQHISRLETNGVHNAAILILDVKTGNVLAYIGNSDDPGSRYSNKVDIIQAPRSTGSILKPFLYAAMLKEGLILPNALVPDIPVQYEGFSPQNYSETFDGAVPASNALSRSLNVPSVIMLKEYGYPRFYHLLKKMHFSHLKRPADYYGLSIILGGAEANLWDITQAYASMSRLLTNYNATGHYFEVAFEQGRLVPSEEKRDSSKTAYPLLDAGSVWCTYKALLEVNRPDSELGWEAYNSSKPIAWKTGTSFGNRDAWAVGTTPEYVVGVWVGNANGQGRPNLTGVQAAAPLLFDVFNLLTFRSWFRIPFDELEKIPVCHESGMRVGPHCSAPDSIYVPRQGLNSAVCSFHRIIHTNAAGYRVTKDCSPDDMKESAWFALPPVQEYYYSKVHPAYKPLPLYAAGCNPNDRSPIGLIYPRSSSKIFIPRSLGGEYEMTVLKATHSNPKAILYWHLGSEYLGETSVIHDMPVRPLPGIYKLTIVDQDGHLLERKIEFIEK